MEFKRENPDCTFTIPDKINVRMQMAYLSAASYDTQADMAERMWQGARELITDWNCPLFPDINAPLDSVENPQVTRALTWAAAQVRKHINGLDALPKN